MSRILLVDDEEELLDIALRFLKREEPPFKLFTAILAQEALQKLEEKQFDVVVSDYQMPEMDGLKLLKKLRDEGNLIPFIMFTGRGREEVAMRALNLGADYYLMKDAGSRSLYGELAHIIRKLLRQVQAEEALKESEKKYRNLTEQSLQSITIFQDGGVVYANPAAEQLTGYTIEEIRAISPKELIHPDDRKLVAGRLQDRLTGRSVPPSYECRMLHKDGGIR